MPDMLVKLYKLPDGKKLYEKLESEGVRILRPMTPNRSKVTDWVYEQFGEGWSNEIAAAFTRHPVGCFIAYDVNKKRILGFAGYDCTYKAYFGPTGVDEDERGRGIGAALLIRCMEAMRDEGYAYAIIGSAGPVNFYSKVVGATAIEDSVPGIYADLI